MARTGTRATWITWADAVSDPACVGRAGEPGDTLRLDSPGADVVTWHTLARLGGFVDDVPAGEWRPGRAWFTGLSMVWGKIVASAGHLVQTHPHALAMTDKWVCHTRLAGVPVPPTVLAPDTVEALRAMPGPRLFVKPRWGSSGAGVMAWERRRNSEQLTTTATLRGGRLLNNKRLRTYTDREAIDVLLGAVVRDGAVVQRWIPKASTQEGPFDLRILVIDGRVAQRVARIGRGPITNLHLDAARGDPDAVLAPFAGAAARVNEAALAAAACFPGHRAVGVDVMVDPAGRPSVIECNAWGDHLPGLLIGGRDSFELQLVAPLARGPSPSGEAALERKADLCPTVPDVTGDLGSAG